MPSLVGSEMCIRDRYQRRVHGSQAKNQAIISQKLNLNQNQIQYKPKENDSNDNKSSANDSVNLMESQAIKTQHEDVSQAISQLKSSQDEINQSKQMKTQPDQRQTSNLNEKPLYLNKMLKFHLRSKRPNNDKKKKKPMHQISDPSLEDQRVVQRKKFEADMSMAIQLNQIKQTQYLNVLQQSLLPSQYPSQFEEILPDDNQLQFFKERKFNFKYIQRPMWYKIE
eukprot:TRINITY_DN4043_c0_g1_i3.p1 TRINITY_DN4043_c0_g1~~TRINITY_DN4043_c0_g1_i3.p1  ORF type:complete len:225 (+),score=56.39 TRINITY_DN4043_c0_g1_i3:93-767(+)